MPTLRPSTFVRDALVATVGLFGLYALMHSGVPGLAIPGYLLVVGFDLLEVTFGAAGANYYLLFYTYLVVLGVIAAGIAQLLRSRETTVSNWRLGLAGVFVLVGLGSLLFALAVLPYSRQPTVDALTPTAITGTVGIVSLAIAAWLLTSDTFGWLTESAN